VFVCFLFRNKKQTDKQKKEISSSTLKRKRVESVLTSHNNNLSLRAPPLSTSLDSQPLSTSTKKKKKLSTATSTPRPPPPSPSPQHTSLRSSSRSTAGPRARPRQPSPWGSPSGPRAASRSPTSTTGGAPATGAGLGRPSRGSGAWRTSRTWRTLRDTWRKRGWWTRGS
jgi:hypothetical protein